MRRSSAAVASLLALAFGGDLGFGAAAQAETLAPPATAEVVRLDVVVTDAHGRLVSGLTRDDFAVLEDGRPQVLTDFVFLPPPARPALAPPAGQGTAAPTASPTAAGRAVPAAGEPSEPPTSSSRGRKIAIVIDELHLSRRGVPQAKRALRRFLGEQLAPDDAVAWVVVGQPAATIQPTLDRVALEQAVEKIQGRADAFTAGQGAQLTPEQAEQVLAGDPAALELATRLLTEDAGQEMKGSPGKETFLSRGASSDPTPVGVQNDVRGLALDVIRQARGVLAEALARSEGSLRTLEQVLRGMAPLAGRKLCLLVSDGFLTGSSTTRERTRSLEQVVDAATRSGTAVYSISTSSLVSIVGDASVVGSAGPAGLRDRVARQGERQDFETLQGLADDTGGFALRGGDGIEAGLARMLLDTSSLYLLAYEPSNKRRDGRFRKIEVRVVGHKDYELRTRKGYFAPDDRRPAKGVPAGETVARDEAPARMAAPEGAAIGAHAASAGPAPLSITEARRALLVLPPAAGLPLRFAADFAERAPGQPEVLVQAQLDAEKLPWTRLEDRQRAEFDLIGGVFSEDGVPGPIFAGRHFAFDLTAAEYDRLKQTGVRFEANVPLKPGRYEIRMLALDPSHAPLGGEVRAVQVPDLAQRRLTLSGLFLSSSSADEGGAPGEGGRLRASQVLRRFKASDSLYYQVYVYNAARDASGASDVVLQSQILSPRRPPLASKPQPVLLREKDGTPLPEADGIPLLGLVPGAYELRIVAVDRKANAVASRSIDFVVVE